MATGHVTDRDERAPDSSLAQWTWQNLGLEVSSSAGPHSHPAPIREKHRTRSCDRYWPMRSILNSARISGALSLSLVPALGLAACSGGDTPSPSSSAGQKLFTQQACVTCHGDHGQGSMLGPALKGVKAQWTREALVEYLNDPQGYAAKDPRLSKQGKKYFQPMPPYKMLKPEERTSLAEYVLSLE